MQQLHGWRPNELIREQVDLLHDVGQSDWKLLTEEYEGSLLTGIG